MHQLTQLQLEAITLAPAEEWMDTTAAWRFVQVTSGAAYWLEVGVARPLAEGEVLVVAPGVAGTIRASQLGDVRLHGFRFQLELLCGFFTLCEREALEALTRAKTGTKFLPSTHRVAQQFAAHIALMGERSGLGRRVAGLELVAAYFGEQLEQSSPTVSASTNALERFARFIAAMPETELINHTPEVLAKLCGCSPRHFNRLFHQQFGQSARARQTELRLQKSRQLLAASDEKIVHVALECGYRNLSLFNALFKKRFQMTPSEWRKNSAKKSDLKKARRSTAVMVLWLVLLGITASAGFAQTNVPTATAASATSATPGTGAKPALSFRVDTYELDGNTLLAPEVLTPIFEKYTGPAITFETMRKALAELQLAYRARGYVAVGVTFPQQQLTNGVVRVKVTEGILSDVVVKNNKHYSVANVLRALPSARTNTMLNSLVFQRELDRANANGDRQIYPVISPGPEPGTTVLELRVKDRLPFHLHMELNNASTPTTPEMRMNLSATHNNLWGRDHQVGLQYSLTPEALKDGSEDSPYIQPYERPLIASYSAYYRWPLAPVNGYPRTYSANDFGYDEVTHRFRPPPLSGAAELLFFGSRSHSDTAQQLSSVKVDPVVIPPTGAFPQIVDTIYARSWSINEDLGMRLSKPLPELGPLNSTVSAGLDLKNFRMRTRQLRSFQAILVIPTSGSFGPPFTVIPSPAINSTNTVIQTVAYLPLSVDWNGSVADKHGVTAFDLNQSFNFVGEKRDFQSVARTAEADGNYYIVNAALTRDQKVWGDWGVRLHADGQWASQPLISNEQFGLGGAAGVRGYRDGSQYGDCGWRVQFEPHTPYLNCGMFDGTVPLLARVYAFADYGQTYALNTALPQRTVSLFGAGCGVDASIGEHLDFRLLFGVPFIGVPGSPENNPFRVGFSLGMQL